MHKTILANTNHHDCAVSYRGEIIENTHRIHVAITDASGSLLYAVGDPFRMTCARSAAKPMQILALLETENFEQYGFEDADIALMCSSHSSEEQHIVRGEAMLKKIGAAEKDLRCGGHPALSDEVNKTWTIQGFIPGALCNNCSAKHIGMLAAAKAIDPDKAENYHERNNPIQLRVRNTLEEVSRLNSDEIKWAIDGCNLPTPALRLRDFSYLYTVLANAADTIAPATLVSPAQTQHLARIYKSMWQFPDMVAGQGRFCTELMKQYNGALVGKLGADGCYGVAIKESPQTRRLGANGSVGIAVKIEDGNVDVLYAVVVELLERLELGNENQRTALKSFHHLSIVNTAGVTTGKISLPFTLRAY